MRNNEMQRMDMSGRRLRRLLFMGCILAGLTGFTGCGPSTEISDSETKEHEIVVENYEDGMEGEAVLGVSDNAAASENATTGSNRSNRVMPWENVTEEPPYETREPGLLPEEAESITLGQLSPDHIYYSEVVGMDADAANYIQELTIYDKEIDDTFVVHISLPPNYDEAKEYPLVVMTDGVWRLSDHPQLRQLMINGEMEEVILVSIGYPNDYDYRTIRERDLVEKPGDFLHFIVDNLLPYLSETFSVSEENTTLAGHSYAGYFAYYVLFHSDVLGRPVFENYYIGSPSMQAHTGSQYISNYEEKYYANQDVLSANLYITVGSREDTVFVEGVSQFVTQLQERNYENLLIQYEVIEDYDHDTVFKPSIHNAMLLFYGK